MSHHHLHFVFFSLLMAVAPSLSATQPLADTLVIGNERGPIHPEKCCWLELPKTERLIAAKRAEECSAIGGPVGRFELVGQEMWLVGLSRCSGDMPLEQVYPEFGDRVQANWLSGVFFAKFSPMCITQDGQQAYRTVLRLEVGSGVVSSVQRSELDGSICEGAP
jgi:hypothetical protein